MKFNDLLIKQPFYNIVSYQKILITDFLAAHTYYLSQKIWD